MKNLQAYFAGLLVFLMMTLSGCEVVKGIFKAGMWVGVIGVVLLVVIVMWIFRAISGRR
jgi:hypothetical protein